MTFIVLSNAILMHFQFFHNAESSQEFYNDRMVCNVDWHMKICNVLFYLRTILSKTYAVCTQI